MEIDKALVKIKITGKTFDKAPGTNGFSTAFYQTSLDVTTGM